MNKAKKSNGFSIMETVIALAVIVIVTVAALSVIMASISARIKATNYSEARDFAHNVIECYKASGNNTDFEANAEFAGIALGEPVGQTYEYIGNGFEAEIKVDFDLSRAVEINIEVNSNSNSNNDENKLSFTYTKGAK